MKTNPLQRLVKHFAGRYSVIDAIADIEESATCDEFVTRTLQQVRNAAPQGEADAVGEDAMAAWFWWKLS